MGEITRICKSKIDVTHDAYQWFTTTYTISAYHHWCCEFESWSVRGVQHYVI
jgi:hypothetical protein